MTCGKVLGTAAATTDPTATYHWDLNGVASAVRSPTHNYAQVGLHAETRTVTNCVESATLLELTALSPVGIEAVLLPV
jgi:hypothetical protein